MLAARLVAPVGRYAVLRDLVHLTRADLYLKWASLQGKHRRVQRAVHTFLRHGYIVVELARNGPPQAVYHPQHSVALEHLVHDDANADYIEYLIEGTLLLLHLSVDAVQALLPPRDLRALQTFVLQRALQRFDHAGYVLLPAAAGRGDGRRQLPVLVRLEHAKAQVLQLALELADTKTAGERRVYFERLTRLLYLLLGRQRADSAHVVESVRQLDKHDAGVFDHCEEHLSKILRLRLTFPAVAVVVGRQLDPAQLRQPVNEPGDFLAKLRLDILQADVRVLHGVVKKRRGQRLRIKP